MTKRNKMYTAAEKDDIIANINLNLKKPQYNKYGNYWYIKHTDIESGKMTESRFKSLSAATEFYEEMYHVFEANYISIKAKQYYKGR